ncbi:hypothetical protein B0H16DRAFT_1478548 [Mycena metata]|uniref:Uncharacterized protein n=1 Tax=Mycena metata TaxID=1033252 RepID=A0AAD7H6J1_9AGAR|nr:hypothetical protein B0H16DRAFT_1478548 [Mycena metata]
MGLRAGGGGDGGEGGTGDNDEERGDEDGDDATLRFAAARLVCSGTGVDGVREEGSVAVQMLTWHYNRWLVTTVAVDGGRWTMDGTMGFPVGMTEAKTEAVAEADQEIVDL